MSAIGQWLGASWSSLGLAVLSTVVIYATVILYTRVAGLRSFAKMSGVDFAGTVAVGSAIATIALSSTVPLALGVVVLATLFAVQWVLWGLRKRSRRWSRALDNEALLLMRHGEVLHDNLRRAGVTVDDLREKLREANVHRLDQVRAVVFETTGDVSVLHGEPDGSDVDAWVLDDVREG